MRIRAKFGLLVFTGLALLLASYGCVGDETLGKRSMIFGSGLAGIALLACGGLRSREYLEIENGFIRHVDYRSSVAISVKDITHVNWAGKDIPVASMTGRWRYDLFFWDSRSDDSSWQTLDPRPEKPHGKLILCVTDYEFLYKNSDVIGFFDELAKLNPAIDVELHDYSLWGNWKC